MLCQICHSAEATVCLIETINNKHTTLNICENCAQKKHLAEMLAKPALAVHELLVSILQLEGPISPSETDRQCPACGVTFTKFKQIGRLGCAECYNTFRDNLLPLFRQFHQAEEHRGRNPRAVLPTVLPAERADLQDQLHQAIQGEQFEHAARLRDQIRTLEGKSEK
jgi:protein arginine kinase activator